jgi:hypothetical protein
MAYIRSATTYSNMLLLIKFVILVDGQIILKKDVEEISMDVVLVTGKRDGLLWTA